MLTDEFQRLACSSIKVDRGARQRREIKIDDLVESVKKRGVIQPIVVTRELMLVAGERRLAASIAAGLPTIPVRFADQLSLTELRLIELEENVRRADLCWQDHIRAIFDLHQLLDSEAEGSWSISSTAERIGYEATKIGRAIALAEAANADPTFWDHATVTEAFNRLMRKRERASASGLINLLENVPLIAPPASSPGEDDEAETIEAAEIDFDAPAPATAALPLASPSPRANVVKRVAEPILHEDFLRWAPKYSGPPFNFIHCDFPYGIGAFDGTQAGGVRLANEAGARKALYSDEATVFDKLLQCLLANFNRLAAPSCHLMLWYGMQRHSYVARQLEAASEGIGLRVWPIPLVWVKTNNAGVAADPQHWPRHIYETALIASRGKRSIVRMTSDAYGAPKESSSHVSEKSIPMLKYFFQMFVDENTELLDPTCGGGGALRAGEELGARRLLGLEINEEYVESARIALRQDRLKREMG